MVTKIDPQKLLTTLNPSLAEQWHPTKNTHLTLQTAYANSGKKAHWQCPTCQHEWEAQIASRNRGNGCPNCAGKIVNPQNSLQPNHPQIAKQYHPTRNNKPIQEAKTGQSASCWWQCEHGHEWKTSPYNRVKQQDGCPHCGGRFATPENNLQQAHPEIAKQWHPTKNTATPETTTPKSSKKVWWQCDKGHEWETTPQKRVGLNQNCPYCVGTKVGKDNNLQVTHPEIAKQYHPTLNTVPVTSIRYGSTIKRWWICPKNSEHVWEAAVSTRTRKTAEYGCRECSPTPRTSKIEEEIRNSLKDILSIEETLERIYAPTVKSDRARVEVDIHGTYKQCQIVIEYDGLYWHSGRGGQDDIQPVLERDTRKTQRLLENDYIVIRIREKNKKKSLPLVPIKHKNLYQIFWGQYEGIESLKKNIAKILDSMD